MKEEILEVVKRAKSCEPRLLRAAADALRVLIPNDTAVYSEICEYLETSKDPRELYDILPSVERYVNSLDNEQSDAIVGEVMHDKFDIARACRTIEIAKNSVTGVYDIYPEGIVPAGTSFETLAKVIDFDDSGSKVASGTISLAEFSPENEGA